jgi:hydrogenase maturation protease
MKTLLLGMGNPILSDDAIGVRLAADFKAAFAPRPGLDIVEECSVGGLNLLDLFRGYRQAIVLDSLQTSPSAPGAWHRFTATALRDTVHLSNLHDANFATALELGRRLGLALPDDKNIHILAVEIQDNRTFSDRMTPALERAYPRVRSAILKELLTLLLGFETAEVIGPVSSRRHSLPGSTATASRAAQRPPRTLSTVCLSTN